MPGVKREGAGGLSINQRRVVGGVLIAILIFGFLSSGSTGRGGGVRSRQDGRRTAGEPEYDHRRFVKLNNGALMPKMGVGTAALGSEGSAEMVEHALKAGYRMIDSASEVAVWYRNERSIGDKVLGQLGRLGLKREDVFITTKLHPQDHGTNAAARSLQNSLSFLKVDRIDLWLIHFPECWGDICAHKAEGTWKESWRVMEAAVRQGKVRSIGVSNFWMQHLVELQSFAEIKPQVIQNWNDPFHQDRQTRKWAADHQIVYQAYSSLGTQWTARGRKENPVMAAKVMRDLAEETGHSIPEVVLAWQMQNNIVVLPRSSNPAHLAGNLGAMDLELTPQQMDRISSLDGTLG